jgi:integrase
MKIDTGITRAAGRAGLEGVTPHVLKHTAITWVIMDGLWLEDAAEVFDTSAETIRQHYCHHSPTIRRGRRRFWSGETLRVSLRGIPRGAPKCWCS